MSFCSVVVAFTLGGVVLISILASIDVIWAVGCALDSVRTARGCSGNVSMNAQNSPFVIFRGVISTIGLVCLKGTTLRCL